MIRVAAFPLTAALALGGCAAAAPGSHDAAEPAGEHDAPAVERDVITGEEIEAAPVSTAFELVRRLRPEFLQPYRRVPSSLAPESTRYAAVYVDGQRWGDVQALHRILVADVAEIRYLRGSDATTRFGIGHAAGAILVTTRHG